ncbi:MAG: hypothetical protein J3K34DRAFT_412556 [Monoraphidium minutum]|nr:MAG: hypothetical protein J3K34DRAFT_412556 [Monoraphidium minutum]
MLRLLRRALLRAAAAALPAIAAPKVLLDSLQELHPGAAAPGRGPACTTCGRPCGCNGRSASARALAHARRRAALTRPGAPGSAATATCA